MTDAFFGGDSLINQAGRIRGPRTLSGHRGSDPRSWRLAGVWAQSVFGVRGLKFPINKDKTGNMAARDKKSPGVRSRQGEAWSNNDVSQPGIFWTRG